MRHYSPVNIHSGNTQTQYNATSTNAIQAKKHSKLSAYKHREIGINCSKNINGFQLPMRTDGNVTAVTDWHQLMIDCIAAYIGGRPLSALANNWTRGSQLADIPPPQSATLGPHVVARSYYAQFPSC